jgi:hypothetical protein
MEGIVFICGGKFRWDHFENTSKYRDLPMVSGECHWKGETFYVAGVESPP